MRADLVCGGGDLHTVPEWVTIIVAVGGVIGVLIGGGGIISVIQARRQGRREQAQDIWDTYEKQIALAEAREDDEEANRLRREYAGQLEAWRAQQELTKLAPREISATTTRAPAREADTEQLKRLLAQSRQLSPAVLSAQDYVLRGNSYYDAEQYDDALAAYDHALLVSPDDAVIIFNRGVALGSLGRNTEAVAAYDDVVERFENVSEFALRAQVAKALVNKGAALAALERRKDAIAVYDEVVQRLGEVSEPALREQAAMALFNKGVSLRALERDEEALAAYDQSLELRPDDGSTHYNRGDVLHRLQRDEEALAAYDRSLESRPDYENTHHNRGATLGALGRHAEALAAYDRALELRSDDAHTHGSRGVALGNLGRFEEALAALDRSLELRPDQPHTLYNRAWLFSRWKKPDQALQDLRVVMRDNPEFGEAARRDPDFDNIRDDPEYGPPFRELVGEEEPPEEPPEEPTTSP